MRRIVVLGVLASLSLTLAACQSLPRMEDVKPARTHVQSLAFTAPREGMMNAKALLVIHNEGLVTVPIDFIDLSLMRGSEKLATAHDDSNHMIKSGYSDEVWIMFRDIPIGVVEKAIGRKLTTKDAEKFDIEGAVTYKTKEGPLRHPLGPWQISTVLGPEGS